MDALPSAPVSPSRRQRGAHGIAESPESDADLVELEAEQLGRQLTDNGVRPGADVVARRCARTRSPGIDRHTGLAAELHTTGS